MRAAKIDVQHQCLRQRPATAVLGLRHTRSQTHEASGAGVEVQRREYDESIEEDRSRQVAQSYQSALLLAGRPTAGEPFSQEPGPTKRKLQISEARAALQLNSVSHKVGGGFRLGGGSATVKRSFATLDEVNSYRSLQRDRSDPLMYGNKGKFGWKEHKRRQKRQQMRLKGKTLHQHSSRRNRPPSANLAPQVLVIDPEDAGTQAATSGPAVSITMTHAASLPVAFEDEGESAEVRQATSFDAGRQPTNWLDGPGTASHPEVLAWGR